MVSIEQICVQLIFHTYIVSCGDNVLHRCSLLSDSGYNESVLNRPEDRGFYIKV